MKVTPNSPHCPANTTEIQKKPPQATYWVWQGWRGRWEAREGWGMLTLQGTGVLEASPKWADKRSQLHVHPQPQHVPLFGNKVYADVIEMRSFWIRGPKSNDCALRRGHQSREEAEAGAMWPQAKNTGDTGNTRSQERGVGQSLPSGPPEGSSPAHILGLAFWPPER